MSWKILVVEDEAPIREMITFVLQQSGFKTVEVETIEEAQRKLVDPYPDLIILDWMLPGGTGIKLAKSLKRDECTRLIPIIMLTARSGEEDKVQGFDAGIDDYITKPFSPKELVARIKAVVRRVSPTALEDIIDFHGITLDPIAHRVLVNDSVIDIGPTEFRLLHFFLTHPERVYSRTQLLDNVWGVNVYVEERTVDVHIRRLRKAISKDGHDRFIQTVRGAGYRFSNKNNSSKQ